MKIYNMSKSENNSYIGELYTDVDILGKNSKISNFTSKISKIDPAKRELKNFLNRVGIYYSIPKIAINSINLGGF